MSNEDIYNKINNCKNKIRRYEDSIDYLCEAKRKALKIESGLEHIKYTQHSKACDECNDAIGYQPNIITALNISNNNMLSYNDNIVSEIASAISTLENKVSQLEDKISSLHSKIV